MKLLALVLAMASVNGPLSAPDTARAAAEEFGRGRLSDLRSRFTPDLEATLGPVRLFVVQRAKLVTSGRYVGADAPNCFPFDGHQRCSIPLRFSEGSESLTVTVDRNGRIAGVLDYGVTGPTPSRVFATQWGLLLMPLFMMIGIGLLFRFRPVIPLPSEAIQARYQRWNIGLALAGGLAMMMAELARVPMLGVLQPILQPFGHCLVLAALIGHWSRPFQPQVELVRTAVLAPVQPLPKWMWALWASPAVIVLGAVAYLAAHWDRIPEPKTFKSVFGLLWMGASVLVVGYAHSGLVVWGARRNVATAQAFRAHVGLMLCFQLDLIVLLAWISLWPDSVIPVAAVLLAVLPPLAMIPMKRTRALVPGGDALEGSWLGGLFYVNRADPAWVVRQGAGFAPNYGHRWVVALMVVILAQMVATWIYVFAV